MIPTQDPAYRIGDSVLPGDDVSAAVRVGDVNKVVLGPGLRRVGSKVVVSRAGVLKMPKHNVFVVDAYQKRYIPVKEEHVVGVVTNASSDVFRVDIGASVTASLSYLDFEHATKKNRPNIQVGDVVYAKLSTAGRDMEPELVCVDSHGKAGKLGKLEDGFLITCSLNLIRKLLSVNCPLLQALGQKWPYECAFGMNGKVWIKARSVKETIAIGNAIYESELMDNNQIRKMCTNLGLVVDAM
ncbi:Exosome complex component RRP40 [Frankliniella fusca]|uniref:Exosome complex component RRP40 n=1 Tax=Frankliniella fusca TaxID=407009 RepID=A0AAE1I0W3_9NEOP|nr:Exosome complex component RRP40 [Frankliniella fusca]